jgi:hypothetical protein
MDLDDSKHAGWPGKRRRYSRVKTVGQRIKSHHAARLLTTPKNLHQRNRLDPRARRRTIFSLSLFLGVFWDPVGSGSVARAGPSEDSGSTVNSLSVAAAATVAFRFDAPTTILSAQEMDRNGLEFPDGTLWFVRQPGLGPYYIFGSGGSFNGVGMSAHLLAGSYQRMADPAWPSPVTAA